MKIFQANTRSEPAGVSLRTPAFTVVLAMAGVLTLVPQFCFGQVSSALSTAQIIATFSDVQDHARLLDRPGTRATNHWYADGRFESEWSSAQQRGTVSGRWFSRDNLRCVVIERVDGEPVAPGPERCGRLARRGEVIISYNPDGSPHGEHSLRPIHRPPGADGVEESS